jgi:phosphoglycolate phosphatase
MKYTDILWDFNGTILDDVDICINSVNLLLSERGLPTLDSIEAYHKVFGFPVIDYYKRLGFDFEKEDYEGVIAPTWMKEYLRQAPTAELCRGVRDALERFAAAGLRQTVISASETGMLTEQIRALGIYEFFDGIYGLDNINAGSKTARARQWREAHPDAVALFLGDTEHDADTARAIGADCVLVASGHQSAELLRRSGCPVIHDLSELKL